MPTGETAREPGATLAAVEAAVTAYWRRRMKPRLDEARALVEAVNRHLPMLAAALRADIDMTEHPADICAEQIIGFAVAGLRHRNPTIDLIWSDYFLWGVPIEEIASRTNYTTRTINRFVRVFPYRIALQLWERDADLRRAMDAEESRRRQSPAEQAAAAAATVAQAQQRILEREFPMLTPRQAEIVLLYCQNAEAGKVVKGEKGRMALADQLYISHATLNYHIGKIVRAVRAVSTLPAPHGYGLRWALENARLVLRKHAADEAS